MAREYFDEWFAGAGAFYDAFEFNLGRGSTKNAAFQLHQSVEQLYHAALLVNTLYTAHAHNIRHLRNEVAKRSEEHTSELQSLMRISYAVFCLKKKKLYKTTTQ